jgi:putative hemolysin
MQKPALFPVRLADFFAGPVRAAITPIEPLLKKLLLVDRLDEVWLAASKSGAETGIFDELLRELGVTYRIEPGELERVPASGPVVLVANHPFGMLEGVLLGSALRRVRRDFKIMANFLVPAPPGLRERFILVNPYGGTGANAGNRRPLREAITWLKDGGLLVVFPAGDVAQMEWRQRAVVDPPWSESVARLILKCDCTTVPVFLSGSNGLGFHLAGAIHPRLRTADLPRQLLNKRGRQVLIRLGRPVTAKALQVMSSHKDMIEYLRWRTYFLGARTRTSQTAERLPGIPVTMPPPENVLAEEVGRLPGKPLAEADDLAVYLADSKHMPNLLREIGRLREITFRRVGEGTGGAIDLDGFDSYYQHLFIWNRNKHEIVGAYRLGPTPDILPMKGVPGLYSNGLFQFDPELFRRIGPAVELGRSFVRLEYQRQFQPLLLLWKGIGQYIISRPFCPILFGAVSISDDYSPASRDLLVNFPQTREDPELARLVRPRRSYRPN